jgi:hypothetical protein
MMLRRQVKSIACIQILIQKTLTNQQAGLVKKPLQKPLLACSNPLMVGVAVKKTAIAIAITFALLFSLLIEEDVARVVKANPYQGADHTTWRFFSPKNQTTYNTNSLNFNFTCTTNDVWNEYYHHIDLEYILDGPDYYNGSTYEMPYADDRIFIEAPLVSEALSGMGNVSRAI